MNLSENKPSNGTNISKTEKKTNNNTSLANHKCDLCNLNLLSKDQLQIHLTGKKHLKKLENLSSDGKPSCPAQKPQSNLILCILSIKWRFIITAELKDFKI